jgi:hypothetical protein
MKIFSLLIMEQRYRMGRLEIKIDDGIVLDTGIGKLIPVIIPILRRRSGTPDGPQEMGRDFGKEPGR